MHTEQEKLAAAIAAMTKEGWAPEIHDGKPLLLSEGNLAVACFNAGYDLAAAPACSVWQDSPSDAPYCIACLKTVPAASSPIVESGPAENLARVLLKLAYRYAELADYHTPDDTEAFQSAISQLAAMVPKSVIGVDAEGRPTTIRVATVEAEAFTLLRAGAAAASIEGGGPQPWGDEPWADWFGRQCQKAASLELRARLAEGIINRAHKQLKRSFDIGEIADTDVRAFGSVLEAAIHTAWKSESTGAAPLLVDAVVAPADGAAKWVPEAQEREVIGVRKGLYRNKDFQAGWDVKPVIWNGEFWQHAGFAQPVNVNVEFVLVEADLPAFPIPATA